MDSRYVIGAVVIAVLILTMCKCGKHEPYGSDGSEYSAGDQPAWLRNETMNSTRLGL